MKHTPPYYELREQRETLKGLLDKAQIKDVAFFWAGRMAEEVQELTKCHVSNLSWHIDLLNLYTIEYTTVMNDRASTRGSY